MSRRSGRRAASRVVGVLDADRITCGLYQGAVPPPGRLLADLGFDALALTAVEHQPPSHHFPGVVVYRAGLDDAGVPMDPHTWSDACALASSVVDVVHAGGRALVTCAQGLNRSGLVVGVALLMMTDLSGRDIVRLIQTRRPGALFNRHFVRAIELAGR